MISVILCTYNRAPHLQETLGSLERLSVPPGLEWELLVVDNNSTDETQAVVAALRDRGRLPIRYIFESQQGKSFALNTGIKEAYGEIIAFTDDDVTVDPRWLAEIRAAFDKFGCVGVGGRVLPVWAKEKPAWLTDEVGLMGVVASFDLGEDPHRLTTPPYGVNMAFRMVAFEKYGLFRTDLGPTAGQLLRGEDSEFCGRLLAAAETIMYAPGAVIRHVVEPERLEKRYFKAWYFSYGRSLARIAGIPPDAVRYLGTPRYLLRELLVTLARWVLSPYPALRFRHQLRCCRIAGQIAESFRLRHAGTGRPAGIPPLHPHAP